MEKRTFDILATGVERRGIILQCANPMALPNEGQALADFLYDNCACVLLKQLMEHLDIRWKESLEA